MMAKLLVGALKALMACPSGLFPVVSEAESLLQCEHFVKSV
jgi:hypothetical protein